MKKLNITKKQYTESKYFQGRYGKLEYVNETGEVFKTSKNEVIKFNESVNDAALALLDDEEEEESGKKYKFTGKTCEFSGYILHEIVALKNFGKVKKGDIGGWIESEKNLSHEGNCWVDGNAKVFGDAKVCDNALVLGNAAVYGNAFVFRNAKVRGNSWVFGYAKVDYEVKRGNIFK